MNFLLPGNTTTAQLSEVGYSVEDMGAEWGAEFEGQWRWFAPGCGDENHANYGNWGAPRDSEQEAWEGAAQHLRLGPYDEV